MQTQEATTFCRTTLNYVPRGRPGGEGGPTEVSILDGRRAGLPGWEQCGFELMRHVAAVNDWSDDDELTRRHHAEMAAFATQLTGCDRAFVGGHIKRGPEHAARHADLGPITLVHSDFADSYGDLIRERYASGAAGAGDAEDAAAVVASASRLLILQFWRNLGPAKMDMPLAFCDARTVPREEIMAFPVNDYAGSGFNFEALAVVAPDDPERHRWYTYPEMQVDEVVAFRTYDTERVGTGEPYWTPHSAFRDPDVELGKPSRSSIELRATCVWL